MGKNTHLDVSVEAASVRFADVTNADLSSATIAFACSTPSGSIEVERSRIAKDVGITVRPVLSPEALRKPPDCHAVVHWNLPPNPVDLEQREGRIHRYNNHAVRKNLAHRYGLTELASGSSDPWRGLFNVALRDRAPEETDLVPFWLYPLQAGASIERHVPMLPLSREVERFEGLRRSLAIYRMAFGQSRQGDLVICRMSEEGVADLVELLRLDLSPGYVPAI